MSAAFVTTKDVKLMAAGPGSMGQTPGARRGSPVMQANTPPTSRRRRKDDGQNGKRQDPKMDAISQKEPMRLSVGLGVGGGP
jgi:hypothetical protein